MIRFAQRFLSALARVGLGVGAAAAILPAVGGTAAPAVLPPLPALSNWSMFASADSAIGFKDNLLLSSSAEEQSALVRGAVETMLMRVPTGPLDYSLFLQAEGTHYLARRTIENEGKAWLQTELGWRGGEHWKLSLPLTGYYYDQVFDQSDTEVERIVAEYKVAGAIAGPTLRFSARPDFWIETQAVEERKRYVGGDYDGRVREAALRVGWAVSPRAEIRLSGARRWRDFDSRSQYSAAGRELVGTRLQVEENESELRFNFKWDREAHWQTVTRAGRRTYRDNGSGYFNYREHKVDHEVEWTTDRWLLRFTAAARRVDFEVQTVGIGISPPPRVKDEYELEARLERKLTARWTIYGSYSWERARSNERVASYRVNEGLLGMRWSWER